MSRLDDSLRSPSCLDIAPLMAVILGWGPGSWGTKQKESKIQQKIANLTSSSVAKTHLKIIPSIPIRARTLCACWRCMSNRF